jgi:hypothetical protein
MARVRTGTIHKLPSGRWLARYTAPGGQRFGKTFLTKTDGNVWLHRQYAAISEGTWEKATALTPILFRDYAANWLAHRTVKGRSLADRAREGCQDLLDRFCLRTRWKRPPGSKARSCRCADGSEVRGNGRTGVGAARAPDRDFIPTESCDCMPESPMMA